MIYIHVINGTVVNIIVYNGTDPYDPPGGGQLISSEGLDPFPGIGWTYDGETFSSPA